ncbi:MAG: LuxR C-terminal-related transcriptional regulator [Propionibacteriaceae bacterium]|nr:LuxR C-terminal-related transcriptional regulator [Propionibacteriaceae bacterium]
MDRPRGLFAVFVVGAGLCLLWYKRVIIAIPYGERTGFVTACALGFVVAAVLLDSGRLKLATRDFALITVTLAAGLTALAGLPGVIHQVGLALAGLCVGAAFLCLQLTGLRALPPGRRATAFAGLFILAGAINTTTDLPQLPWFQVQGQTANLLMGCVCLGLAAAVLAWRGRLLNLRFVAITESGLSDVRRVVAIGLLAAGSFVLLYASLSLRESVVYPVAVTDLSANQFIRYIELPLFLGAGLAADRFGRQNLVLASLVSAFVGSIGVIASGSVPLASVSALGAVVATIVYPVACCALMADAACYSRRPALLGCLAFAPVLVGQLIEAVVRPATADLDPVSLFLVDLALLVACTVLAVVLLELIRLNFTSLRSSVALVEVGQTDAGEPDFDALVQRYGLTAREREILTHSVAGMTVPQMAAHLFVTEATIKFHITNLLKKTGAASRAELAQTVTTPATRSFG